MSGSESMIKTVKVKEELTFRELMEYILENDISDREFRCLDDNRMFRVCEDDMFDFYVKRYNVGETYEVEVEETITEDTKFVVLVEIFDGYRMATHFSESIRDVKDSRSDKIYALIDGELQLVWDRDADD